LTLCGKVDVKIDSAATTYFIEEFTDAYIYR